STTAFINKPGGERMTKMRIYEYAKEQHTSSKKVIDELKKMNIEVKNHMSTISAEEQKQLNQRFQPKQETKKNNQQAKPKQTTDNKQKSNTAQKGGQGQKQENRPAPKGRAKNKPMNKGKLQNKKQKRGPKNKPQGAEQQKKPMPKTPEHVVYSGTLTVSDLAEKLHKDVSEIIKKLMFLGVMANKNQDLDDD